MGSHRSTFNQGYAPSEELSEQDILCKMGERISKIEDQLENLNGVLKDALETIKRKDFEIELLKQMQSNQNSLGEEVKTRVDINKRVSSNDPRNPLEIIMPLHYGGHHPEPELNFSGLNRELRKQTINMDEKKPSITSFESVHSDEEKEQLDCTINETTNVSKSGEDLIAANTDSTDEIIMRYWSERNSLNKNASRLNKNFSKNRKQSSNELNVRTHKNLLYFLAVKKGVSLSSVDRPEVALDELNKKFKTLFSHALNYS